MASEQRGNQPARKGGGFLRMLVLLFFFGAAAVYLSRQEIDWAQKIASLQDWLNRSPPVRQIESKPVQPARLAPSFDIVSADENGMLVAAGRSEAGWAIRIQNQSLTMGEVQANDDGEWVFTPERPLEAGEYVLSLLAINPMTQESVAGKRSVTLSVAPRRQLAQSDRSIQSSARASVNSNVSKPEPEQNTGSQSRASAGSQSRANARNCNVETVKQGDTLWQIANDCYGDGTQYQKIVRSNQQAIKDPNLIFPNQQLTMPR